MFCFFAIDSIYIFSKWFNFAYSICYIGLQLVGTVRLTGFIWNLACRNIRSWFSYPRILKSIRLHASQIKSQQRNLRRHRKKKLDNISACNVINGNSILSINQIELDKKMDSFTKITLHQLLHDHNISSDKNEIKNLLLI